MLRALRASSERGSDDWKGAMAPHLVEAGIARENLPQVLGAIERTAHELRQEGDALELDPGMARYLESMELTEKQHGLVMRIAKRLSMAKDR